MTASSFIEYFDCKENFSELVSYGFIYGNQTTRIKGKDAVYDACQTIFDQMNYGDFLYKKNNRKQQTIEVSYPVLINGILFNQNNTFHINRTRKIDLVLCHLIKATASVAKENSESLYSSTSGSESLNSSVTLNQIQESESQKSQRLLFESDSSDSE